jgi:hypothetical protein
VTRRQAARNSSWVMSPFIVLIRFETQCKLDGWSEPPLERGMRWSMLAFTPGMSFSPVYTHKNSCSSSFLLSLAQYLVVLVALKARVLSQQSKQNSLMVACSPQRVHCPLANRVDLCSLIFLVAFAWQGAHRLRLFSAGLPQSEHKPASSRFRSVAGFMVPQSFGSPCETSSIPEITPASRLVERRSGHSSAG